MKSYSQKVLSCVKESPGIAEILIGKKILGQLPNILKRNFSSKSVFILADQNTWQVAGFKSFEHLSNKSFKVSYEILDSKPEPSVELAQTVMSKITFGNCILLAIGSGVINDLGRYIAFDLELDYACIATAASMDGYASAGSPLSINGFKKTINCKPAKVILADLDLIASAPQEMVSAGYADIAGKIPAGADWILSDRLGIEPVNEVVWSLVHDGLKDWLPTVQLTNVSNLDSLDELFARLTMIGLAMEKHGSSRPASGADHQIAHIWEMEGLKYNGQKVSHGHCVAIGCLIILKLYEWLCEQKLEKLQIKDITKSYPSMDDKKIKIKKCFGSTELMNKAVLESTQKHLEQYELEKRLFHLVNKWREIRESLKLHLVSFSEMKTWLANVNAPSKPSEIGLSEIELKATVRKALWIRSRYTILDILFETGLLDDAIEQALSSPEIEYA